MGCYAARWRDFAAARAAVPDSFSKLVWNWRAGDQFRFAGTVGRRKKKIRSESAVPFVSAARQAGPRVFRCAKRKLEFVEQFLSRNGADYGLEPAALRRRRRNPFRGKRLVGLDRGSGSDFAGVSQLAP